MDNENKEDLIYFLTETEKLCPELIDLFYPITRLAFDFLYVFEEKTDDDWIIDFDNMPIHKTLDLVCDFLNSYDNSYLNKFKRCIADGTFDIFYKEFINDEEDRLDTPISIEKGHYNINVPIEGKILDGAIIIHEFFHFTNSSDSKVRFIFTELISIYMELKYYKFLESKGYSINNFYKELFLRINDTYICSDNIFYSGSILDIYENTNDINKDNILFIDKYRDRYEDDMDILIDFSNSEDFTDILFEFPIDTSYLFGCVIALNLLKDEKLSDIKIKYINENIDNLTIEEVLKVLNIDLDKYQQLIDYCEYLYDKAEGVLNESNNNSRSYVRRKNKTQY